jgi:hypothetical protein
MHLAPLFGIRLGASNSSEIREESLSPSINRVHGGLLCQPRPAHRDVEAHEVLHCDEIGGPRLLAADIVPGQLLYLERVILIERHLAAY